MLAKPKAQWARKSVVLGLAILSLSACGKNMHIAVDNKPQSQALADPNAKKLTPKGPSEFEAGDKLADSNVLTELSMFDTESEEASKYLKKVSVVGEEASDQDVGQMIGHTAYQTEDKKLGFNKKSLTLFRAFFKVPKAEEIESLLDDDKGGAFSIRFRGMKKFASKAEEISFAKQKLCVLHGLLCSGDDAKKEDVKKDDKVSEPAKEVAKDGSKDAVSKPSVAELVSDVFSKIETKEKIAEFDDGVLLSRMSLTEKDESAGDLIIDMNDLFKIYDKSAKSEVKVAALVQWINDHSVEYTKDGYRKMLFKMGNQVTLDSGDIAFRYKLKVEPKEPASAIADADLVNGIADAVEARSKIAPIAVKLKQAIVVEATTPTTTVTTNSVTAKPETKKPEEKKPEEKKPEVKPALATESASLSFSNATLKSGSLTGTAASQLADVAKKIAAQNKLVDSIEITGYGDKDAKPNEKATKAASESRAQSAKKILESNGVKASISAVGKGWEKNAKQVDLVIKPAKDASAEDFKKLVSDLQLSLFGAGN